MSLYTEVLVTVAFELDRDRWDAALIAALDAWRVRRLPRLADLVEVLGRQRPGPAPTTESAWFEAAASYDPLAVEPLLATFATVLPPGGARRPEVAERCAAIEQPLIDPYHGRRALLLRPAYAASWPADPRVAPVLLDWYERLDLSWPAGGYGQPWPEAVAALRAMFALIYPAFAAIADARMRERLAVLARRPPARQKWSRAVQAEAAVAALAVLDELVIPPATEAELRRFDALIEQLGGAPRRAGPTRALRSFAPDELWRQIAAAPDDDAPRMLLADLMLDRGDPRGLAFAHQLGHLRAGVPEDVHRLWRRHWDTWLGEDLARVLVRKRCAFVRGMLDTVTVGRDSPGYLFDAAVDHRELLVVRRVFPNRIHPPHYGRFVAALPNVRVLGVEARGTLDAVIDEAAHVLPQITALHWEGHPMSLLARLAPHAPAVTTITTPHLPSPEIEAEVRAAFPLLATIERQSAP